MLQAPTRLGAKVAIICNIFDLAGVVRIKQVQLSTNDLAVVELDAVAIICTET